MSPSMILVDAYSSAAQLAAIWRKNGFRCLHVQSQKTIPPGYVQSFRPEDFDHHLIFKGDLDSLLEEIANVGPRSEPPTYCLAGIETGVPLADLLSEALRLPSSNGTKLSRVRRNKFSMQERLHNEGIRSIPQKSSDQLEDILEFFESLSPKKAVVKPLESAGADQVHICTDAEQVQRAFHGILHQRNQIGILNRAVLIQAFIEGEEYAVNAISCQGRHYFTHVWQYHKSLSSQGRLIYDWEELKNPKDQDQPTLLKYVESVLDAFAIQSGPSHSEVKIHQGLPTLIETAARIDGINLHQQDEKAFGETLDELNFQAYHQPTTFWKDRASHYTLTKNVWNVAMISHRSGTVRSLEGIDTLQSLPSVVHVSTRVQVGDSVVPTVDIFTSPGQVYLTHSDLRVLQSDYERIREIEKTLFF